MAQAHFSTVSVLFAATDDWFAACAGSSTRQAARLMYAEWLEAWPLP